jgi:predicted transcriptional regulator
MKKIYIERETMDQINKFIQQELKSDLLAKSIHKLLNRILSKQALAMLDKKYLANGLSREIQIEEISKLAVQEVFSRDYVDNLDEKLLNHAWKKVYSAGVCPTNTKVRH